MTMTSLVGQLGKNFLKNKLDNKPKFGKKPKIRKQKIMLECWSEINL